MALRTKTAFLFRRMCYDGEKIVTGGMTMLQSLEFAMLDWIQLHCRGELLDVLLPLISWTCNHGELWILLAVCLLVTRKHRRLGLAIACALVLDLLMVNLTIKPLVGRLRPFAVDPSIQLLVPPPGEASFPSGHTACSFAAAAAIWCSGYRKSGAAAFALAAVIAFSRLYLYVHWPSDVAGGALIGLALGWLGAGLADKLAKR